MSGLPAGAEIHADPEAAARAAAERVVAACAGPGPIGLCLSGGATPRALYAILATPAYRDRVTWDRVHVFWGDERVVPDGRVESNAGMARAALLDHVPVRPENVHPIPTDGAPDACAARYEAVLKAWYGAETLDPARPLFAIDLVGIGPDGHTASLFPGKPEVEETGRWAVAVPEPGLPPPVPRVSLTLPVLGAARHLVFLVTGANKREALGRIAAGARLPAARLRGVGETVWLLDRAAAGESP